MKLIIPDKFRGTLTAARAARAIAEGLGGDCLCLPMADGGEGTADAIPGKHVIESAAIIGHSSPLRALPITHRSSYSLGSAISTVLDTCDDTIYIALGGTATADGGAGLLQALGARFYSSDGSLMPPGATPDSICRIAHADLSDIDTALLRRRLLILSDVEAALTDGPLTALDFLPQKGATADDTKTIEQSLRHLHSLLGGTSPYDGAGGGTGYALAAVAGCRATLGAAYILDHLPVDWSRVRLVATGEGCIDKQSLGGKVVGSILRKCEKLQIPVIAFGGKIADGLLDSRCIQVTPDGQPLPSPDDAYRLLSEAARKWAKKVENFPH